MGVCKIVEINKMNSVKIKKVFFVCKLGPNSEYEVFNNLKCDAKFPSSQHSLNHDK